MKTITAVIALTVMLVACSEKQTQVIEAQPIQELSMNPELKACMETDNNAMLVELRKEASNPENPTAKYTLRHMCQAMLGQPTDIQVNADKVIQNMETK